MASFIPCPDCKATVQVGNGGKVKRHGNCPCVRISVEELSVALSAIPALMNSATQVREAQRARGSRGNLGHFTLAFLIVSLKHADEVGEALAARGAE